MTARHRVAIGLQRIGLQRPALRVFEWTRTIPALPELIRPVHSPDDLPLPPPIMRVRVTGISRADEFLAQSRRSAATIERIVAETGPALGEVGGVLDFGCGCGRVMRQWARLAPATHLATATGRATGDGGPVFFGSDYNPPLVGWCEQNLPFARFAVNGLEPPLPYADESFDVVYSLSVFTHLPELLQHRWMQELRRVVRPGGRLLLTTRGDAWAWKLTDGEKAAYDKGQLVMRYEDVAGTNLCAAFHPEAYVRRSLADGFTLLGTYPAAVEDGLQDVHVLQRV